MKTGLKILIGATLLAAASFTFAQTDTSTGTAATATATVLSASDMRANAQAQAAKDHKSVFLIFHASWCIWCHRLDDMLNDPKVGPIFSKHFEIVHIDGMESPDKKDLENSGWKDMLTEYKGDNQGIPFFVFLNAKGKVLASSLSPFDKDKNGNPGNLGFPSHTQPNDEKFFIDSLKKAGAKLSSDDVKAIMDYLAAQTY